MLAKVAVSVDELARKGEGERKESATTYSENDQGEAPLCYQQT